MIGPARSASLQVSAGSSLKIFVNGEVVSTLAVRFQCSCKHGFEDYRLQVTLLHSALGSFATDRWSRTIAPAYPAGYSLSGECELSDDVAMCEGLCLFELACAVTSLLPSAILVLLSSLQQRRLGLVQLVGGQGANRTAVRQHSCTFGCGVAKVLHPKAEAPHLKQVKQGLRLLSQPFIMFIHTLEQLL